MAETDPGMRRAAHRAMLAGRVHDAFATYLGRDVDCRPPRDFELGVTGRVAVLGSVTVLEEDHAPSVDKYGSERLISFAQCLAGEVNASAEKLPVLCGDGARGVEFIHMATQPVAALRASHQEPLDPDAELEHLGSLETRPV
jgi:hypothetical protein